jgi:hypothetical protein
LAFFSCLPVFLFKSGHALGLRSAADEHNARPMSKTRSEVLQESKRKGVTAGLAAAATVAVGVTVGGPLVVIAAVPTAILGWRWWKHRAENGIRF